MTEWVKARDRLRLAQHMANVLMETPEFQRVDPKVRELRALVVATAVLEAAEHFIDVAKVVDRLTAEMFPPGTPPAPPP